MRVLVHAGYVRSEPWEGSSWVGRIAGGLAGRGHRVLVACDGLDDEAALRGCGVGVEVFRRERGRLDARPGPFVAWSRDVRSREAGSRVLSLTGLVEGEVWLAVDAGAAAGATGLFRTMPVLSAGLELVHHPWVMARALAERGAARRGLALGSVRLCFGEGGGGRVGIGYAGRPATRDGAARSRVRRLLRIEDSACVVAASLGALRRGALRGLMGGVAGARRAHPGLVLVAMTERPTEVTRAAEEVGCASGVVVIGMTGRVGDVLSASDGAAAVGGSGGVGSGRFIADALSSGLWVASSSGASGVSLLRREGSGGEIVHPDDPGRWAAALSGMVGRTGGIVAGLEEASVIGRIERALEGVGGARAVQPGGVGVVE
ncbi:MAG: hypothetical protein HRU70_09195 [Phycisphaeraceae bacterium]|nr:MAG: hypothetical protein HRU70_09195 [Phycisphaeraceae bacterium]